VQYHWSKRCLPAVNLRYETFGDAAATQRFIVKVPRLGVQTVVQPGATLLDALEQAGIEVMSDCRTGECGLCEVDVLGVVGVIDHRDVFYSRRQQQSDCRMCSCVSRVTRHPPDHVADGSLPEVIIDVPSTTPNCGQP
jgi:ferredoxin